jgi:cyclin-dependent kinase
MTHEFDISKSTFISTLGEGSYGRVEKRRYNGRDYAVKIMTPYDKEIRSADLREAACLIALDHPNVVKAKHIGFNKEGHMYIVMDLARFDLTKLIGSTAASQIEIPLTLEEKKKYIYQMLCGVGYLHANNVLHRDLKPQNLLINQNGNLEVADFGMAVALTCVTGTGNTKEVVTLWYRSPEVIQRGPYQEGVDKWAVGCIIFQILTGKPLFTGDSDIDQLFRIYRKLGIPTRGEFGDMPDKLDFNINWQRSENPFPELDEYPELKRMVTDLLNYRASERPSLTDLSKDPYFNSVRNTTSENYVERACLGNLKFRAFKPLTTTLGGSEQIEKYKVDIEWMEWATEELSLKISTYFYAVGLYNRVTFISQPPLICVCMYLASLYLELQPPVAEDFEYISDYSSKKEEIYEWSEKILCELDFDLVKATCYNLFREYRSVDYKALPDDISMGTKFLRFFTFERTYRLFDPSDLALVALLMECTLNNIPFKHTADLPRLLPIYEQMLDSMIKYNPAKKLHKTFSNINQIGALLKAKSIAI